MGTGNHIQTLHEIFDQSIEYTDSIDCHLSIYLTNEQLAFAIYAKVTNTFIGLGQYLSPQHNCHHLTEILEQFTGDFGSVSLALDLFHCQFLPEALFTEDQQHAYQHLIAPAPDDALRNDRLYDWELAAIYKSDPEIESEFKKHFPNVIIRHAQSFLLDYFLEKYKKETGSTILVQKTASHITIIGIQNGLLHVCNQFEIATPEDFAYYTMLVIDQMKCTAADFKLVLLGKRVHYFQEEALLQRYVKAISFFERPTHHMYSPELAKATTNGYHQLFIQFACVS